MFRRKVRMIALGSLLLLFATTSIAFGIGAMRQDDVSVAQVSTAKDFYVPSSYNPWGTTFDSTGRVWVAIPGCDPSPSCSSSTPPGKIAVFNPTYTSWNTTYTLPSGFGQALFLAFDHQGRLWFPMPSTNALGMYDPASNSFQQWTIPTSGAGPWGVAIDSHGRVWFTEHYVNKIGYFDLSSQTFGEISTPASNSQPYGIAVDASDNVWFTENNSSVALIAEYTTQGNLREYSIRTGSTSGLTPHLIALDTNGNVWWTEGWVGMIGVLRVAQAQPGTNQGVTEYTYPRLCSSCSTHTSGIGVDTGGNIWFDDSLQSLYGSFPNSGSGAFSVYGTPTSNSHPHDGMNVDSQNRVFFDEEFANKLAMITTTGGTPVPTATPSPTPSLTATSVASPTPTATSTTTPTPGTTLAQDTFQRANQSHWGTASDGHAWGSDASTASAFSIASNSGRVSGNGSSYSAVLGSSTTNGEVFFSGSVSSFSNANIGAVLRWTDGNNWYKAYIDGTNLIIQRKVSGNTTVLATAPFAATAGTAYSLHFRVVGTTLTANVWAASGSEPSGWMVTATDSSFTSGFCGLRVLIQGGNTATITSFSANSL